MDIYKEAQNINFQNPEGLRKIFSRLNDRDFKNYISALMQIHEDLLKDETLTFEKAVSKNISDDYFQREMLKVIDFIGTRNFETLSFENITSFLENLRQEVATPIAQPPKEPVQATLEERIQNAKSIQYPIQTDDEAKELARLFSNLDQFYIQLLDDATPYYQKAELLGAIEEIIEELDGFQKGEGFEYLKKVDEETVEESIEISEEEEEEFFEPQKKDDKAKIGEGISLSDEDEELVKASQRQRSKTSVDRTEEEAIKHQVFGEDATLSKYFDTSQIPPVFDSAKYEEVYSSSLRYFDHLFDSITKRIKSEKFFPPANMVKEFNDFMFSIKVVEKEIKSELIDLRNSKAISDEDYRNLFREINSSSVALRIGNNEVLFKDKILIPLVYMGSSALAKAVYGNNTSYYASGLEDFDQKTIKDTAKNVLERSLYKRFKRLLDPSHAYYERSLDNFLNSIEAKYAYVSKNIKRELKGRPAYERTVYCPTCSKEITWTYSKEIRESLAESKGVLKAKRARGFEIPVYSMFRKSRKEPGKIEVISIQELLYDPNGGERKFPPPEPSEYNSEIEKRIVSEYKGNKTWNQINELIYSGDRDKHEEGWHRRAAALRFLGGRKVTTAPILIRGVMSECPYQAEGSFCGLSYQAPEGTNNIFNLQPTESFSDTIWRGENIVDRDLRKPAAKRTAGGYKFSRLTFACPAHWTDIDSTGVELKHFKVALSSIGPAGSEGYIPPVDGRTGMPKQMPNNTMSYLVCGASTSISSFDRDPGSHGYVVNILSKVRNINSIGYIKVLEYLIKNGIDVNDLLHIDSEIKNASLNPIASEAIKTPDRKKRLEKVAELIAEAAVKVDTEEYEILKDVMLVCPHGHRFTIGHSIEFNEKHAGLTIRKSFAPNKSIFENTGLDNLDVLKRKGYLVKASKIQAEEKVTFSNWDKKRLQDLIIYIPNSEGEMEGYIFNPAKGYSKNIFRISTTDYPQSHDPFEISKDLDEDIASDLRIANIQRKNKDGDRDISGIENMRSAALEQNMAGSERPPFIPGFEPTGDLSEDIRERVLPLARAIKASLKIVQTWTKGVANSKFAEALVHINPAKISSHSSKLIQSLIKNNVIRYVIISTVEENGKKSRVRRSAQPNKDLVLALSKYLAEELTKVTNFYGFFENSLNEETVPNIVGKTTISSLYSYMDTEEFERIAGGNSGFEFNEDAVLEFINNLLAKQPAFTADLARVGNTKIKTFVGKDYLSRIYIFSYALYLTEVLVEVYENFLSKYAIEPIGYDIGIDLSTAEKILEITDADIDNITTSLPRNYLYMNIREDDYEPMARNIDSAYQKIRESLAVGRRYAASPASLTKARAMILERLDNFIPEGERENAHSIFNAAFPTKFMGFDKSMNPQNFIPAPSTKPTLFLVPGGLDGTIEESGIFINESINYRNDRFQVGMVGPKPSKMTWPLELKEGFVGLLLPFPISGGSGRTVSKLSDVPIVDFSIYIQGDTGGEDPNPLDISPFFRRGRTPEQTEEILSLYSEMKKDVQSYKTAVKRAKSEEARASLQQIINKKLEQLHARIKSIPLEVRTKRSILESSLNIETREKEYQIAPYAAITIVEPGIAIDLIENPYLMTPDINYQPDVVQLKNFIVGVYKLDLIAKIIQEIMGEEVTVGDLMSSSFYDKKLGKQTKKVRGKINTAINEVWKDAIGTYYDVIPNETEAVEGEVEAQPGDKNTGSFVNYLFRYLPSLKSTKTGVEVSQEIPEGHLNIMEMESVMRGLIRIGAVDTNKTKNLLGRVSTSIVEYLDAVTSGEFEKEAANSGDSEIIQKIAKRKRELERTILSMGLKDLYID